MLASIKNDRNNIDYLPVKSYSPPIPLAIAFIIKDNKGCKSIYKHNLNKKEPQKSHQKWKNDLSQLNDQNINTLIQSDFMIKPSKLQKIQNYYGFSVE